MCWHKWSKWRVVPVEITAFNGTKAMSERQTRQCEKCGLTQMRPLSY